METHPAHGSTTRPPPVSASSQATSNPTAIQSNHSPYSRPPNPASYPPRPGHDYQARGPTNIQDPANRVAPPRPTTDERLAPLQGPPPSYSQPPSQERSHVIRFYHSDQPYYQFTNFAPYAIHWDGRMYPTAEHLFQAHKFMPNRPDLAERIRFLPDSRFALDEARNLRAAQRSDWFDINVSVMDDVLEAKFAQHLSLRDTLLSTSDNELIEDSPVDSFWGCGQDGLGKNELGKALMRLREKLRAHPARRHFAWTSPPPDRERRSEGVQPVPENSHGMTHAQLLPAPVKDQGTSQWHSPEWWG